MFNTFHSSKNNLMSFNINKYLVRWGGKYIMYLFSDLWIIHTDLSQTVFNITVCLRRCSILQFVSVFNITICLRHCSILQFVSDSVQYYNSSQTVFNITICLRQCSVLQFVSDSVQYYSLSQTVFSIRILHWSPPWYRTLYQ
jgi:hypothetical protein